jgi:hypothetical protein
VIQLVLIVVTAVAFLLWYIRAYRNAIALGIRNPRWSTRWAAWSWFVPIANLFRPKTVMNDIYRGSDPELQYGDRSFASRRVDPLLHWWWGLWLLSHVTLRYAAFSSNPETATLNSLSSSARAYVYSDVLDLIAAVLAIAVVKKITDRAELRRHRFARREAELGTASLGAAPSASPPPATT